MDHRRNSEVIPGQKSRCRRLVRLMSRAVYLGQQRRAQNLFVGTTRELTAD
jgi:hypothetical protein